MSKARVRVVLDFDDVYFCDSDEAHGLAEEIQELLEKIFQFSSWQVDIKAKTETFDLD